MKCHIPESVYLELDKVGTEKYIFANRHIEQIENMQNIAEWLTCSYQHSYKYSHLYTQQKVNRVCFSLHLNCRLKI